MVRWALQSCTLGLLQHHLLPNLVIFATISQTVIPVSAPRAVTGESVPRMDRYADFGTSVWTVLWVSSKISNTCLLGEKWFNCLVHSDCGNIICYSIGAYPGGPCSPRVRHVHPVRRSLKQPNASGRSCATPLLPGVRYWSRFFGSRLWNLSVFKIRPRVPRDACTCPRGGISFDWIVS